MRDSFYPSDEYDSRQLELEASQNAKLRLKKWLGQSWRHDDDDDDPPPAPLGAVMPRPTPPLVDAAA